MHCVSLSLQFTDNNKPQIWSGLQFTNNNKPRFTMTCVWLSWTSTGVSPLPFQTDSYHLKDWVDNVQWNHLCGEINL